MGKSKYRSISLRIQSITQNKTLFQVEFDSTKSLHLKPSPPFLTIPNYKSQCIDKSFFNSYNVNEYKEGGYGDKWVKWVERIEIE